MRRLLVLAFLLALLPAVAHADGGPDDRVSVGTDVVVPAGEVVRGNLVVVGGNAEVQGEVRGDVVVVGGALRVGGHVGGQVVAIGGPVTLAAGARLEHDLAVVGGRLDRQGGLVAGRLEEMAPTVEPAPSSFVLAPTTNELRGGGFVRLAAMRTVQVGLLIGFLLAIGLAGTLFFPRRLEVTALTLRHAFGPSLLVGLLSLPAATLLALALLASLVGALLGLLVAALLAAGSAVGLLALAHDLGELAWERYLPRREPGPLATTAALLVLGLLLLPVFTIAPLAGILGLWLLSLPGLGALLLSRLGQAAPVIAESPLVRRAR